MTTLSERIAAVMARVTAEVPEVTWSDASREWESHASPPRVLWRRTTGAPSRAGQLHDRSQPFQRAILGRAQAFQVKVWGADWTATDTLFAALVRALEAEASGAWSYQGDEAVEVGQVSLGEALLVSLVLTGHVPEAAPTTVLITSASVQRSASAASGDGELEPGDP